MRDRIRAICAAHTPDQLPLDEYMPAAVMVLLHQVEGVEHLIFQQRTQHVRHHRGQISLPGGRHDPGDPSLLHTALRETHEEIGVLPDAIEVLGQLSDTLTITNYLVRPYVGALALGARPQVAAPRELTEVFSVPLDHLLSARSHAWYPADQAGTPVAMPAYQYEERMIWGATARVLRDFIGLLGGDTLPEAPLGARQPGARRPEPAEGAR